MIRVQRDQFLSDRLYNYWWLPAMVLAAVNLAGIGIDLAEPDAALYAEVAREMYASGDWLSLTFRDQPFLDKPHLPFWLTAASYKLFGVTSVAYRLPSLVMMLIGMIYSWKLAANLYDRKVAATTVLMLLATAHLIGSNVDVRAEGYLFGFTAFAFYYLIRFVESYQWRHLCGGAFGAACLLMTKGLFTLMPLFFGIVGGLLLHQKGQLLYSWRWLSRWIAGGLLTLLCTAPVMIAYALQFDLQPDLSVPMGDWGEVTGVSGIQFFWWESQFGRFFNSGPIRGDGNIWFFLHTLLWALFPWAVLWYIATGTWLRNCWRNRTAEAWCVCAVVPTLIVFSLSSFQLPHYLNPLFPLCIIPLAGWLHRSPVRFLNRISWIQLAMAVPAFAIPLLVWYFAKPVNWLVLGTMGIALIALICIYRLSFGGQRLLLSGLLLAAVAGTFFTTELLPWLSRFQAGSQIAHYLTDRGMQDEKLYVYGLKTEALDVYMNRVIPRISSVAQLRADLPALVIAKQTQRQQLILSGLRVEPIAEFEDFAITRFNPAFFFRESRAEATSRVYLARVSTH